MGCYLIPAMAAIVHYGMRRRLPEWRKSTYHTWLGMMLAGGATFGIVDHLWNGELLMFGDNIVWDLMLGVTITLTMLAAWGVVVALDKAGKKAPAESTN